MAIKRLERPEHGPLLINGYGGGGVGKTRLFASCFRGWPEQFGDRGIYVGLDPASERLDSVLPVDRPNLELVGVDMSKDVYAQLKEIYTYNWAAEGFKTIITDTLTTAIGTMLTQFTNSGKFSDKNIDLGNGMKLPQPGDYNAANTLTMGLLRFMQTSNMNCLTLYHEQEVRPEPGTPGEPYGGPATVGKALVRTIGNLDMTVLRLGVRRPKGTPLGTKPEMERVVYTDANGIWASKLRTPHLKNPCPEIVMEPDPVNVWYKLKEVLNA